MAEFSPESGDYKSFEEQFENRQKIESLGGVIEVVDVMPERPKTEVPVIFAPGWGETPETFKDSVKTMAELERRVLSLEHSRGGETEELPQTEYPADELRKALALIKVLEEKGIDRADIIAHSEGAINSVIAAAFHPEKIRSMVLVGPGGLIGPDKFPKLVGRFSLNVIRSAVRAWQEPDSREAIVRDGNETGKYILKNIPRAWKEAVAISESDIHEALKELHEQGIGVAIIHGVDDPVFPMDKIQEVVKKDQIDGFYSVKGDHNEIWIHPEKYVALADQALDALEKKRQRGQNNQTAE